MKSAEVQLPHALRCMAAHEQQVLARGLAPIAKALEQRRHVLADMDGDVGPDRLVLACLVGRVLFEDRVGRGVNDLFEPLVQLRDELRERVGFPPIGVD